MVPSLCELIASDCTASRVGDGALPVVCANAAGAAKARDWARRVKRDAVAVYFAARDPRTPMPARGLAIAVAAYALSPIDLIPDFIPILGYLDDLLIVPLGLLLVIRLLPPEVLAASREKANTLPARPKSDAGAVFIAVV